MWITCYDYVNAERWFFAPLLIGLPICVAWVTVLISNLRNKSEQGCGLTLMILCSAFSLFWVIAVGYDLISTHLKYRSILADHRYREVEGPVEHFGQYYDRRYNVDRDTFHVRQMGFMLKDKYLKPVPATIDSSGQPLADGRWVKVWYALHDQPDESDHSAEANTLRRLAERPGYKPVILRILVRDGQ